MLYKTMQSSRRLIMNMSFVTVRVATFKNLNLLPRSEKANKRYKNSDNVPRGPWQSVALQAKSGRPEDVYTVKFPNGVTWTPPSGTFPKFTKDKLLSLYEEGYLFFGR